MHIPAPIHEMLTQSESESREEIFLNGRLCFKQSLKFHFLKRCPSLIPVCCSAV